MTETEIKTVGVIGAGTMGNGIAHVFARSGLRGVLCVVEQRVLDRGFETIRKNLGREAEKGKISLADSNQGRYGWPYRWLVELDSTENDSQVARDASVSKPLALSLCSRAVAGSPAP